MTSWARFQSLNLHTDNQVSLVLTNSRYKELPGNRLTSSTMLVEGLHWSRLGICQSVGITVPPAPNLSAGKDDGAVMVGHPSPSGGPSPIP